MTIREAPRKRTGKGMQQFELHIGGKRRGPASGDWFETFDPYRGEPWAEVARGRADDVDAAVEAAHRSFVEGPWPRMTPSERGTVLRKVGDHLAGQAEELARREVQDNGKLMAEMMGQLRYVPQWFYYYGGLCDKIEGAVLPIDKPAVFAYTRKEPLGVCAAITAWNSPILLAVWKIAPALAAGNTVVVKPSEFASTSTLAFVQAMEDAGLPPGVVNVVTGFGAEVGDPLVRHSLVRHVSFTGSLETGRKVGEAAGSGIKTVNLELGGKSPNIVFADANLDNAVKGAIAGIFAASGQTCIAGSRLLLEESICEPFLERLVEFARTARMGDPMDMETQVGPVTTRPQFEKVLSYIDVGRNDGARLVLGGEPASRPECGSGWFVEPTIFSDVSNDMRIAQEEVFGPVLSVIPFRDEADAVRIANDVSFGLAAGVWTQNLNKAHRMAAALQAGTVWINMYRAVSFTAPFGGYKNSGIGRENGQQAIDQYLQTKSVWLDMNDTFPDPFVLR